MRATLSNRDNQLISFAGHMQDGREQTSAGDAMIEAIAEAVALKLERIAAISQRLMDIDETAKYLGLTPHALQHKAAVGRSMCKNRQQAAF